MTSRFLLRGFAAAALITVTANATGAQAANSTAQASAKSTVPRAAPSAKPADASVAPASATPWDAHPTGKYLLELSLPDHKMQADLTISDSAGTPVALFWPAGDNEGHRLSVTVQGVDLKLYAETPRGPFSATLQRDGDHITGHYAMGIQESGAIEGRVEHSSAAP